jgi:tetratricopeptide (TPR) repeat protein
VFFTCLVSLLLLVQAAPSGNQVIDLALQDMRAGKYGEAREMLQRALGDAPQNALLWSYLGEVNAKLQHTDAAIKAFQKARSLTPQDPRVCFNLGVLYMQKKATAEALEMYRQGLALDSTDVAANQNYAFLLMQEGKYREAVAPLERLKRMSGADLSVRVALIESLLKCGEEQRGHAELGEFLDLPSATVEDRMKLAKLLMQDHLRHAAQETLESVLRSSPDLAEAHADLGLLFLQAGQFEEARLHAGRAVQLEPDSADYCMLLAQILLKEKQYPTALAILEATKDRFGSLAVYQYKLAWAHYGLGHVPTAAALLETLVQQHPRLDRAHYSLGDCYVALGKLQKAEAQYRAAIGLNPKDGSYHAALGLVLRKEHGGRIEEAIGELEKAQQLNRLDVESRVQLAICYEQKTQLSKAEQLLETAIQEQPSLEAAHRVLARVYYRQGKKELGDRETEVISKLDSEETRRRARLIQSSPPESFQ